MPRYRIENEGEAVTEVVAASALYALARVLAEEIITNATRQFGGDAGEPSIGEHAHTDGHCWSAHLIH